MPTTPEVVVEMTPLEFPVTDSPTPFRVDDEVRFTQVGKPTLDGRITKITIKNAGNPPKPALNFSIAITDGALSGFARGGFGGYTLTNRRDSSITCQMRSPCLTKAPAQLMDRRELQVMMSVAQELIWRAATFKMTDHALKWFGKEAFDERQMALIHKRTADLRAGVEGLSKVIFQCASVENLGAIDTTDPLRHGPTCRIRLGRGFTYDRYSWGERVCTIIHELTHWFLSTVDTELEDGTPCYGAACLRLANNPVKSVRLKALNNADNWGYYICEYRSSSDGRDWRFFTEEEIRARGEFVSGGYNTVPGVLAFYGAA